jgi:acyl-CoA dehydrogenase
MPCELHHLAWPFFEPRHREFAGCFAAWTASALGDYDQESPEDGATARKIFRQLGEGGWLGLTLPEREPADTSLGLDLRAACLLREILAFESVVLDVAFSEPWLGILPIHLAGSAQLKSRYLPGYRAGELLPAFALSEPDAGSDAAAINTTAHRDGAQYVLNGRKTWTSNAGSADLYVVFARMQGSDDQQGLSAFAVDGAASGIVIEDPLQVMSPHSVATWRLQECRIPADCLIGGPGDGMRIAMAALEAFRPTVGAATLGMSRRAMSEAVTRSLQRSAFRKPIAEYQIIQAKIADMAVKVDASALLVYRAAWQSDTLGRRIPREAAIAKLYASEAASSIIDQAVQVFGGLGVKRGTAVERLYRHSRPFRIFDGTSEIQQMIIARDVLRA